MVRQLIAVPVVALCVGVGMAAAQSATSVQQQIGDTFIWHGELVSYDQGAQTLTVKAQVLAEAEKAFGAFKAGQRVQLTWSGADKYASAIRAASAPPQKVTEPFSVIAELASQTVQGGLVSLRFRVPGAKADGVKMVKPGEWVTITTKQRPASETDAITMVEQYVKPFVAATQ